MPEHRDTKRVINSKSISSEPANTIFVKRRPFGRSNIRRAIGLIPSPVPSNLRNPVSLGEVKGAIHVSASPLYPEGVNTKSSRRGKEHMRPKISESGMVV